MGRVKYPVSAENSADANSQASTDLDKYDTSCSPFLEIDTPFTAWEAVKMALLIITVIPRCIIALILMLIMAAFSSIALIGCPPDQPLPPSRKWLVSVAATLAGGVAACCFVRIRAEGLEHYNSAKRDRAIAVFNHSSYLDGLVLMYLFAPSGVAKQSVIEMPLIGQVINAFQNISVPDGVKAEVNGNGASNGNLKDWTGQPRANISQLIAKRAADPRYPIVFLAPEGTCGDNRCILQFRTGAFVSGLPVLPVLMQYNLRWHNPSWTIIQEGWHFLRLLCQFDNYVKVTVLPPYYPTEAEKANPKLYAANVRALYSKKMGLPMVNQSHLDFRALNKSHVTVSWDGRKVEAPKGVLSADGRFADLTKGLKQNGTKAE